jgi:NAD-dependent deacetylase
MPSRTALPPITDLRLRRALKSSRIAVLTGAGISAESGIPTFRGDEGLWKKFKPEELASMDAFMANPDLVLEWYRFRRGKMAGARPNEGHKALARWQELVGDFCLITQNVDGLHQGAGSQDIIELHGNIWRDRCMNCERRYEAALVAETDTLPTCECGGRLRPDVVWFGEWLPPGALEAASLKAAQSELFLSIGTSAVVRPAADLPMVAKRNGSFLLEINAEPTPLSGMADATLFGAAGEVLPGLLEVVES